MNSVLAGFYIVAILASSVAGEAIEKQEEHIAQKVFFIKNMQNIFLRFSLFYKALGVFLIKLKSTSLY